VRLVVVVAWRRIIYTFMVGFVLHSTMPSLAQLQSMRRALVQISQFGSLSALALSLLLLECATCSCVALSKKRMSCAVVVVNSC
jgi:hypothetical protein